MSAGEIAIIAVASVAGVIFGAACVRLLWRAIGIYRIRRAGPRMLRASRHRIWTDPGVVERVDLATGPGGPEMVPRAPFRFVEEHLSGSHPCVSVTDASSRRWRVKWGPEVQSETFAVRLVWACGYFAETTHFLPSGTIAGASQLTRASSCLGPTGTFTDARFELDDPAVRKLFEEHSWAWNDNPFVGTRELQGLKILVMLLSDWDTKDRRDVARGSNTAIFEHPVGRWRREARYLITDWGGSMGRWGGNIVTRGRWDAAGFEAQNPEFVVAVDGDVVKFGYAGQRTGDVATGISVDDVRWLLRYLGRLTDAQIGDALATSGATDEEKQQFTRALRDRIVQLQRVCSEVSARGGEPGAAAQDPVQRSA